MAPLAAMLAFTSGASYGATTLGRRCVPANAVMGIEPSPAMLADLYGQRFSAADRRAKNAVWRVLCRSFVQHWVPRDARLLDLGAGLCEFVNNIEAGEKWALDINPDLATHAAPGVHTHLGPLHDLGWRESGSTDVVFASNVFEHCLSKTDLLVTLREIHRVLRPGGRLLVLGPNIRFTARVYWDFFDHHTPLSDRSMAEALTLAGFRLEHVRARFLPYTTKSGLSRRPVLVQLYLRFPPLHWLFGGQMFLVAVRP